MRCFPLLLVVLAISGCVMPPPSRPALPVPPPAETVSRADLCAELAAQVSAKNLDTTDELVRVLRLLQDAGHWSAADSAAVDAAIPDLAAGNRPLTADDASRLKGVK